MQSSSSVQQFCRSGVLNGALLSQALAADPADVAELTARLARANGHFVLGADIRAALAESRPANRLADLDDEELGLAEPYNKTGTDVKCTCRGGGCP